MFHYFNYDENIDKFSWLGDMTLMMCAAREGRILAMFALLELRADVDINGCFDMTVLYFTCSIENVDVVDYIQISRKGEGGESVVRSKHIIIIILI